MFREVFRVEGVDGSFIVHNENVFALLKRGRILCYNLEKKEKAWEAYGNENALAIGFLTEFVYCNSDYATRIIDPTSGHVINQYNFEIMLPLPDIKGFLSLRKENGKKILGLVNIEFKNLWQKEIKLGNKIASLDHILVSSKYLKNQAIAAYDVTTFELLWDFNIAPYAGYNDSRQEIQEGVITNILGIYGDKLWLGISSGKIVALNIRTGAFEGELGVKETKLPKLNYPVNEGDYIPWGDLMQLDQRNQQIVGLRDIYFMRVDLIHNQRREYVDVSKSMNSFRIRSSYSKYTFPIEENYIYFCDDRQGKIGVFDRDRLEVVWSYELEMERDGIAQILDMKYANNRWYILDRNGVLHVFERVS